MYLQSEKKVWVLPKATIRTQCIFFPVQMLTNVIGWCKQHKHPFFQTCDLRCSQQPQEVSPIRGPKPDLLLSCTAHDCSLGKTQTIMMIHFFFPIQVLRGQCPAGHMPYNNKRLTYPDFIPSDLYITHRMSLMGTTVITAKLAHCHLLSFTVVQSISIVLWTAPGPDVFSFH